VLIACADPGPLGAGFLVMERAPGRPLLEAGRAGVGRALAEMQARLHALDPEPLLRALDDEGRAAGGAFDRGAVGLERHLATLEGHVARARLSGLAAGMRWLLDRCPRPVAPAICHADFHPQNLLMADGRVTAVLDWPNVIVTDPEYDVASTRVILAAVPVSVLPVPAALRPVVAALRRILLARYLSVYRRLRPLDRARLPYFEAAACMRGLVRVGAERAAAGATPSALDASTFGERLAARFTRISGMTVALPPRPRMPVLPFAATDHRPPEAP
jgi:aminoglycoside phosphotransferase (APT) family kinase protein